MSDNSCSSLLALFVVKAVQIELFFMLLLLFSGECLMFKSQMLRRKDSGAFKLRLLYSVSISYYLKFSVGVFVNEEMLIHKNPSVEMNRKRQ